MSNNNLLISDADPEKIRNNLSKVANTLPIKEQNTKRYFANVLGLAGVDYLG